MKTIKIKAPAKINLTLKVLGKAKNGFHEIESVMQTVSLFDYITLKSLSEPKINLSGSSAELKYDESNIAHKAAKLFFETSKINQGVEIFLEKNIPISAGLAGGSTDAAAVLYGLNKIFDKPFETRELLNLCEKLGSDLNFCLVGGRALAKGRGEILQELPFEEFKLIIVKPKNLGISAGEAYSRFDDLKEKSDLKNDLEFALLPHYQTLKYLNSLGLQMSGSGSAFFKIGEDIPKLNEKEFQIIKGLEAVPFGVLEV